SNGDLIYAVPGSPLIAERTVPLVLEQAGAAGIDVRVYSALSFVDTAATALRKDLKDIQLCDALDLRIDSWRPALVSQVFSRNTAAALKLELLESYPPEHEVAVLHALGSASEAIRRMPLAELDHGPLGYLDTLYIGPIDPIADVRRFDGLKAIVDRLNAPDGCPWDREQTHLSLRPHLLEEAYEALEAIDEGDPVHLAEELGDVLLQVLMHAAIARREGEFEFGDVASHIATKLVRRHPHVFGDATASTAEEVYQNWDQLKKAEKQRESQLDGVPTTLPALAASQSLQGRARRSGFDWPDIEGPLEKLQEEIGELARAPDAANREDEFGDVLFVLANVGQRLGIDAEQALRGANLKFRRRFGTMERLVAERGVDFGGLGLPGMDLLWDEAKELERGE
ncbi:MAG TPA: nucleoside triphosphate pyrophosphohydrolase, partial [Tepidiformaceae bacterium]|nr:nucleoside triphosphate pyrophosphohydrolase [Tepidiformaceae bacterium]